MHATAALADYVASLRGRAPSAEEREAATRCVLDLLAAVAAGVEAPGVLATRSVADAIFGGGTSPVWFTGETSSIVGAAWSNSAAASALDLDDGHRLARGHPGAAVIPAAFAVAADCNASFDDLIMAIVAGYEVGVSVAASRGFYARTGMWSGHGVVAASGLLRKMPADRLAHAFGIAGMTAPNLLATSGDGHRPVPEGNDVKEGIPWSVACGLAAVRLAEAGFAGPRDVLDHAPHHVRDTLIARIGTEQHICSTYFKLYAACRHVHAPVDALLQLIDRHGLDHRRIEAVEVHIYDGALQISNRVQPANLVDVQFSIPYCLGLAAIAGPSILLPLANAALGREEVSQFARKVTLHLDPALDARFPRETLARLVVFSDGRRYESDVTAPRCEATQPLSWQELEAKFLTASSRVADAEQQAEVLGAVRMFREGDAADLMRTLAGLRFGNP
jgi:2-methylcitrate dehydratase PrpD